MVGFDHAVNSHPDLVAAVRKIKELQRSGPDIGLDNIKVSLETLAPEAPAAVGLNSEALAEKQNGWRVRGSPAVLICPTELKAAIEGIVAANY